jgi:kynureninase
MFADLDAADPLSGLREGFHLPNGVIYLDGHSLGALPMAVPLRMAQLLSKEWGRDLISSWWRNGWERLPRRVGERLEVLVGAEPGTMVATDSTSVNWFKAVSAALELAGSRRVVLTDSGNFPTNLYVLGSLRDVDVRVVPPEEVVAATSSEVGVVALTHVDYRSGRRHDLAGITALVHSLGAIAVWDLSHSAGVMAVDLARHRVDLAVGCGYKYLNGGPGAPAFIYVAPRHQERFRNPIAGWFGHAAPFDFSVEFVPAQGIERARIGTPHILSLAALDAALEIFDGLDMSMVREKSVRMTSLFIDLVEGMPGFDVVTPRESGARGGHVSLRHPRAAELITVLAGAGIIGDFRPPDLLRFGFSPLYNRYGEVMQLGEALRAVGR